MQIVYEESEISEEEKAKKQEWEKHQDAESDRCLLEPMLGWYEYIKLAQVLKVSFMRVSELKAAKPAPLIITNCTLNLLAPPILFESQITSLAMVEARVCRANPGFEKHLINFLTALFIMFQEAFSTTLLLACFTLYLCIYLLKNRLTIRCWTEVKIGWYSNNSCLLVLFVLAKWILIENVSDLFFVGPIFTSELRAFEHESLARVHQRLLKRFPKTLLTKHMLAFIKHFELNRIRFKFNKTHLTCKCPYLQLVL